MSGTLACPVCGNTTEWTGVNIGSNGTTATCGVCETPVADPRRTSGSGQVFDNVTTHGPTVVGSGHTMNVTGAGAWQSPPRPRPAPSGAGVSIAADNARVGVQTQVFYGPAQFGNHNVINNGTTTQPRRPSPGSTPSGGAAAPPRPPSPSPTPAPGGEQARERTAPARPPSSSAPSPPQTPRSSGAEGAPGGPTGREAGSTPNGEVRNYGATQTFLKELAEAGDDRIQQSDEALGTLRRLLKPDDPTLAEAAGVIEDFALVAAKARTTAAAIVAKHGRLNQAVHDAPAPATTTDYYRQ